MNNTINFIKYFKLYISILFIFSVFYLYGKYNVGNDSTVSEWLINYEGGFTKRGLTGQIAIYMSEIFNYSLRKSIRNGFTGPNNNCYIDNIIFNNNNDNDNDNNDSHAGRHAYTSRVT